jgi:hypothetical protein
LDVGDNHLSAFLDDRELHLVAGRAGELALSRTVKTMVIPGMSDS